MTYATKAGLALTLALTLLLTATSSSARHVPPEPDQGISSPTHKANVGRIVFAKGGNIAFGKEKPARFTTSFTGSDTLYARLYFATSPLNAARSKGFKLLDSARRPIYDFYLDGKLALSHRILLRERTARKWTTMQLVLLPRAGDPNTSRYAPFPKLFRQLLAGLPAGRHQVTIKVRLPKIQLAEGSFALTLSKADVVRFARGALPKPGMKDKKVSAMFEQVLRNRYAGEKTRRVIVTSRSWKVSRNRATGIVLERSVEAVIGLERGSSCRLVKVGIKQPHLGGGKYGAPEWNGASPTYDRKIACSVLK